MMRFAHTRGRIAEASEGEREHELFDETFPRSRSPRDNEHRPDHILTSPSLTTLRHNFLMAPILKTRRPNGDTISTPLIQIVESLDSSCSWCGIR